MDVVTPDSASERAKGRPFGAQVARAHCLHSLWSLSMKGSAMHRWKKGVLLAAGAGLGAWLALKTAVRHSRWFDFAGKSVLIMGGSRGLGLVLARQLVSQGAKVSMCARTEDDVQHAADELRANGGDAIGLT